MPTLLEPGFRFLFKYSPYVFKQGQFVFSFSWRTVLVALLLLILAAPVLSRYRKVRGKSEHLDRVILTTLRVAALSVLLFCLFQPSLVISTAVPQENFVGVLIDDSRSMEIADRDQRPRSSFVQQSFGAEGSALLDALSENFKLRFFRFSETSERLASVDDLGYRGDQTDLSRALDTTRQELASLPLAGLVLISDGADNSLTGITDSLQSLRAASVPVFPVGLGVERFDRDIEIARVEAPRSVLAGSTVSADVVIKQKGFGGSTVLLVVESSQGIINTQEVELPRRGDATVVKVSFTLQETGPQIFRFRIALLDGEMVRENNQQEVLIVVRDRTDNILYYEGSPRFEVKFIRRAVTDDRNLRLVVLQGTAENKFLRLDVENDEELFAGFPKTREELYRYRGLIMGSVKASAFTADQLQMIADFVNQRGGGFMMLGGHHSFAEGGYAGTPVADVLPVVFDAGERSDETNFAEVHVELTLFGKSHPVTRLEDDRGQNAERWATLPPLTVVNRIQRAKPGAATLMIGTSDSLTAPQIILAYQRYGSGKALAFTAQDSWQWQMHYQIPLEDMTHETLWRQLLRWLVQDVPGQVQLTTAMDRSAPSRPVTLTASVKDDTYIEVNDAEVIAHVQSPSGLSMELPMEWTVQTDGEYRATFTPEELGFYQISVEASRDGETIGQDNSYIETARLTNEYFDAEMRSSLLQRIAEETGGRFYTPRTVDSLPEDIGHSEGGTTVLEVKGLWDMPVLFLVLVALVATEWSYRKIKGLV